MSNKPTDVLQELVQIARDSQSFYQAAVEAVDNPVVKPAFQRMADAKAELIGDLSTQIAARGETPDSGGTFAGGLRRAYGELLAALGRKGGAAFTYTAQLEETEDRLLRHFERALAETESPQVRNVLMMQLPKLRRCHDEMERLKTALAA